MRLHLLKQLFPLLLLPYLFIILLKSRKIPLFIPICSKLAQNCYFLYIAKHKQNSIYSPPLSQTEQK